MNDRLQQFDAPVPDSKVLVAQPQMLGIIPTWWFWSDDENWYLVRGPASCLVGIVAFIVAVAGLSPLLSGVVAMLTFVLAIGLLERYIRKRVM